MSDDLFTFTVTNNTDQAIAEIWASLDEEEWSSFDLPEEGIPSGESTAIAWAEHTNDLPCEWYVSFVFEDESESDTVLVDFCKNPDITIG